jgi:hypothetical protein
MTDVELNCVKVVMYLEISWVQGSSSFDVMEWVMGYCSSGSGWGRGGAACRPKACISALSSKGSSCCLLLVAEGSSRPEPLRHSQRSIISRMPIILMK